MAVEVRFTPKSTLDEVTFTILETNKSIFLIKQNDPNIEDKIELKNENGVLSLLEANPFDEDDEIVSERLLGLSTELMEKKSDGFENTSETMTKKKPGYKPEQVFVENKPFSIRQIYDLIKQNDIELSPDFQRNFIWDKTRQSRLIESILLGLPLPSIYLSQYENGILTVVDGLQRLNTIQSFMDNNLKLTNLEYLTNCNGKIFKEIDQVLDQLALRKFGQTQIMCFVIDHRSPSALKYDLFRRLNTGGRPLNNSEIRNCLSKPALQRVLKEMINLPSFRKATSESVKDTRMEARGLALRYIYFSGQYSAVNPIGEYDGDLEHTLDTLIDQLNEREYSDYERILKTFNKAMINAYTLYGEYSFRKLTQNSLKKPAINKLLFLTHSILLSYYSEDHINRVANTRSFTEELRDLFESNNELFKALSFSTTGKSNIELCFKEFERFYKDRLGDRND